MPQLGIDTGGTCTDAVIIDAGRVVAKRKRLTTAYDLSRGIDDALAGLPRALLAAVDLVALSTTLSTNSVVEGRGAPVSVLLPGYTEAQAEKSGIHRIIEREFITVMQGGHDAVGAELAPLDLDAAAACIESHKARVSAFAISALFATRNPAHEIALRDLASELSGRPIACGHELATALGAPQRALTAALNARMIPHIQALIDAVESILQARNITAPLMIVKGDGSLVSARAARLQPLATALSGPAASVTGACALSAQRDAIVVDMGGTTTDIAVVTDGRPALSADGARIGDWQPMIDAVRVFSAGLGGDSEVTFKGELALSHRRVVPLCLLAHQFPAVRARLELQLGAQPNPRHNRFAMRLQKNDAQLARLTPAQLEAWESLADGPVELDAHARPDGDRARLRALAALERMNLAIYSGFTPSDATHVLGLTAHWDAAAARLAALIWARQMRHLYGCGDWPAGDAEAPCRAVFDLVVREIAAKLIEAGLNQHGKLSDAKARNLTRLLGEMILDGGGDGDGHSHSEGHGVRVGDGGIDGDGNGDGVRAGDRDSDSDVAGDGGIPPRHPRSPLPRHPRSLLSGGGGGGIDGDGKSDGAGHSHGEGHGVRVDDGDGGLVGDGEVADDGGIDGDGNGDGVRAGDRDSDSDVAGDGGIPPRHPRSPLPRHPRVLLSGGGGGGGDGEGHGDGHGVGDGGVDGDGVRVGDGGSGESPPLFRLQFARGYPLVAVGGPAPQYFPAVARALGMRLKLPPHAETANAIGAALGVVAQTARVTVTQPEFGVFYLFHAGRPLTFESLPAALAKAAALARAEAESLAAAAGAVDIQTRVERAGRHVRHDIDGELFVSATLTATATGRPRTPSPP